MAKENIAKEKLRIIDTLKENATLVISVGGFVWLIFQFVIIPLNNLQYQVGDIINNHIKTIQDSEVEAKTEREIQGRQLTALSEQIVRLQTIIENKK